MSGEAREHVRSVHPRRRSSARLPRICRAPGEDFSATMQSSSATPTSKSLLVYYPRPPADVLRRTDASRHRRVGVADQRRRRQGVQAGGLPHGSSSTSSGRTNRRSKRIAILLCPAQRRGARTRLLALVMQLKGSAAALHRAEPTAGLPSSLSQGARRHHLDGQARRRRHLAAANR